MSATSDGDADVVGLSQLIDGLWVGSTDVRLSDTQVRALSPLSLAYIGDAVYELFVRNACLWPPKRAQVYHRQVVSHVCAERQAHYLELLEGHLTAIEEEVARRGRNAASRRKTRARSQDYQKATGLEALMGYLYLTNPRRLAEVLSHLPVNQVGSTD